MVLATFLEILTPTMGGFTFAALGMAAASIYFAFLDSPDHSFGYFVIALDLALFPISIWVGLHFLKRSPLMLRIENVAGNQSSPDAPPLNHLVGKQGQSITPLRPAGSALIGEDKIDVVTEGKFVDPGIRVVVIRVEGSRVVVEPFSVEQI